MVESAPYSCRRAFHKLNLLVFVSGFVSFTAVPEAAIPQTLPSTQMTCPASGPIDTNPSSNTFSSWFTGGVPGTLNAVVSPADSLHFTNNPGDRNTDFYRWSYRMFLWLTSPTPATYGGTGLVMSSPEFYNVAPNASGDFVMTSNPTNPFLHFGPIKAMQMARQHPPAPLRLGLRVANLGPHGLPTVHDTAGNIMEVLPTKLSPAGKPLLINEAGKMIELSRVIADAQGQPRLLDKMGKTIQSPQFQAHSRAIRMLGAEAPMIHQAETPKFVFRIDPSQINRGNFHGPILHGPILHGPIFFGSSGNPIPGVVGDSENNVQMTQNGSLIYYGMAVNDVYAYFVSQINPLVTHNTSVQFPTDATSLGSIQSFASGKGHTLLDPNSLAMEIKTSWVDASTLSNPGDYITMKAVVPTYNKPNQQTWTQNGTQTITVALIGMHVVGSTAGHPEMVWSTFEHFGNTPNIAYGFTNPSGVLQNQPADPVDSSHTWLFCAAPAPGVPASTFNANAHVPFSAPTTVQNTSFSPIIRGASVLRLAPWGAPSAPNNTPPNPLVSTIAQSNTQVISLNNDIHTQMNAGDIRNKYFFLGATWTIGGAAPTGASPSGNVVGTSALANSTLETFSQTAGQSSGNGCLSCHTTNTVGVSHLFAAMQALP